METQGVIWFLQQQIFFFFDFNMKLNSEYVYSRIYPFQVCNNIFIGYSGGIDSHVLLDLLVNTPEIKHKITAVYIHHGLQACADDWAEHCRIISNAYSVNFRVLKVNAHAFQGQSPEEAARNVRYQAFREILAANDILLFAQHRNDQLETVLLQLFRGAGLKGLSGMPVAIEFSKGMLIRPLLEIDQHDIRDYAQQQKLQWIEDPSNQDVRFERNYLRQQVIPLLKQRWPGIETTVSRSAGHCAQAQTLLSADAREKMFALYDSQCQCLSVPGLLEQNDITQQWIVREWLNHLNVRMPSLKVMTTILQDVVLARREANPVVQLDGYTIQRYRDGLYVVSDVVKPELSHVVIWKKCFEPLILARNGQLIAEEARNGIARHIWEQGLIQVKYRQGGEKLSLANRDGRHSLKKLYQEAGIAPWLRDLIPLIYINGELAAVGTHWMSASFYVQGEASIKLLWQ